MKNFILYLLLLILAGEIVYLSFSKRSGEKVLAEKTVLTPTPMPTESPLPSPSPSPISTPKPTPVKTRSPVPEPKVTGQEINGFIDRFAAQYNVDPNVLRHIAICESGFNPAASNSGYAGLFQFGKITWSNLRMEIGEDTNIDLRFNAEEASQTAAYALSRGKSGLWPNCHP